MVIPLKTITPLTIIQGKQTEYLKFKREGLNFNNKLFRMFSSIPDGASLQISYSMLVQISLNARVLGRDIEKIYESEIK